LIGGNLKAALWRLRTGAGELIPGPRSLPRMARRVGYFVLSYFGILFVIAILLTIFGIIGFVGLFASVPFAIFMAFQFSRAAVKAEETPIPIEEVDDARHEPG